MQILTARNFFAITERFSPYAALVTCARQCLRLNYKVWLLDKLEDVTMKKVRQEWLSLAILLVSGYTMTTNAALINRGSGMVYDDVLDVTWLQDANYARTSGFDSDGLMTWEQANSWANSLVFGGYSDWRLPTLSPVDETDFNILFTFNGNSDRGYNTNTAFSEMAHMFFNNLGNISFFSTAGVAPQAGSQTFSSSFWDAESGQTYSFKNIGTNYWTNFANVPFANAAWGYNFKTFSGASTGEQILLAKAASIGSWALRDGDVLSSLNSPDDTVALSAPSTIGMFLSGLFVFVAVRRQARVI